MGRIKTQLTKRTSRALFAEHKELFKADFNENKKIVTQYLDIPSKKLRNIIAGYTTRLAKQKQDY